MALSRTGDLVDPYGGKDDLKSRQLRHVSGAFNEDPLRVLRGVRFWLSLVGSNFTSLKIRSC